MNDAHDTGVHTHLGPSDLPAGWRSADEVDAAYDAWTREEQRRQVRRRLLIAAAALLLLAVTTIGVVVWNAQAHYGRGQAAVAAGAYALAADEFGRARIAGRPYRDAVALERQARASMQTDMAAHEAEAGRHDRVLAKLVVAADGVQSNDASAALAAVKAAKKAGLDEAAPGAPDLQEEAALLLDDAAGAARLALSRSAWNRAATFAAALLVLDPRSEDGIGLARRAKKGMELQALLDKARTAAGRGSWSTALRLAAEVMAARKDFPGAARVAKRAQSALAAARAHAAARALAAANKAAAQSSPATSAAPASTTQGSTPQQPPPP